MTPLDAGWLAAHPVPHPGNDTDKNRRGHVLVAGGSASVPGAPLLTGEAAFRAGAGKVQLAVPGDAATALGVAMPEAAVYPLEINDMGELAAGAGDALAKLIDRCDTLVLGPGMGAGAEAAAILRMVLDHPRENLALVLDAAMIPAAAALEEALRGWRGKLVLTPHPGEMAGLMGCDEEDASPALAEQAAARFDAVVVLKMPETWIAVPGQPLLHYPGGGPGLATGGSGDVLAGIIGGLLSRGAEPRIAAAWGVWLHGESGRRLAKSVGPLGFLARELLPEIPGLLTLTSGD